MPYGQRSQSLSYLDKVAIKYVWKNRGDASDLNIFQTIEHGDGGMILRICFEAVGTAASHKVEKQ